LYGSANAEIYDTVFHSNTANSVSNSQILPRNLLEIFVPIPGGGHATFSMEGQFGNMIWPSMELLSSMIRPSTQTTLAQ
jgi:hypothetical protein